MVMEAPISSGYSVKVLDFAQTKFPGMAIKAVITTSDAWPHFAGLREYVARGIPVYVVEPYGAPGRAFSAGPPD